MQNTGSYWYEEAAVAAAAAAVVVMAHGGRVSIAVSCQATGTATVEYTLDDPTAVSAIWIQLGTVNAGAKAGFSRLEPTRALRVSAATAGCSYQVLQGNY